VQELLLGGLLTVWLTAAASAGIKFSGVTAGPAAQPGGQHLVPLLPPFASDFILSSQLSVAKDGTWGLLGDQLAWQARCLIAWPPDAHDNIPVFFLQQRGTAHGAELGRHRGARAAGPAAAAADARGGGCCGRGCGRGRAARAGDRPRAHLDAHVLRCRHGDLTLPYPHTDAHVPRC